MRNWLIELRSKKYCSQKLAAEDIGISVQFYNFIENGERRPSVETAKKIAEVLGFDWTKFFEDEGEQY